MSRRIFFGWWVVSAFCLMVFLSSGIRFAVGPFLKPMVADLGLDRAALSLVVAVSLFLFGAFMPFVGRAADVLGARTVVAAGTVVASASMVAVGLATRLWHLYVFYGVAFALGMAMMGHVVASAVVSRWFTRRRSTALSLLGSAGMAGMSLLVPAITALILGLGWRGAWIACGVAVLVLVLPAALGAVRDSPESMGFAPDGAPASRTGAPPAASERTAIGLAVQTRPFWQLAGPLCACGFSMSLLFAHGFPMLTDHGYAPMTASWVLGVLGMSSMGLSVVLGMLADRFGRRPLLAWIYAARVLSFAGLFLIRDAPGALVAVALFGGATMAGTLAMSSAITADIFGRFSVGTVFGVMFLVHQAGAALGSWLGGFVYETTGGYGLVFLVACVALLGAAGVSLAVDERPRYVGRLAPVAGGR